MFKAFRQRQKPSALPKMMDAAAVEAIKRGTNGKVKGIQDSIDQWGNVQYLKVSRSPS
jgi:hypothetical protein